MLDIQDLHAGVDNKEILKGLSLNIKPGEMHAVMGRNGSGKSTQAKKLVDYLNKSNQTAIFVREPGGTTISEEIRDILLNRPLEDINDRTEALLMTGKILEISFLHQDCPADPYTRPAMS